MEKVKHLPISRKALEFRLHVIRKRIQECEGGIPSKFWCDDCKRLMKKMQSLITKMEDIEQFYGRTPPGVYANLGNYLGDRSFSIPSPTFKYRCLRCGRTWAEGKCLGIYRDLSGNVDRCVECNGIVDEIKI